MAASDDRRGEPAPAHAPDDTAPQALRRLIEGRREKLVALAAQGLAAYPYRYEPTHSSAELRAQEQALTERGETVRVAGRLMAKRGMGKTLFAPLHDAGGAIQLYFKRDELGEERFQQLQKLIDIGDWVGAEGTLFRTRTGELTVHVRDFAFLYAGSYTFQTDGESNTRRSSVLFREAPGQPNDLEWLYVHETPLPPD